jgi:predicted anti-sigma-YlaC factor YlaD
MTSYPTVPISCEAFDALLADYLEDALNERDQHNAEAHVANCARCRGLVVDLVELREEAARLPELKPTHDLWDGIASRIEAPAIVLGDRRMTWRSRARLAAAAVVLVAATATVTWKIARTDATVATASGDTALTQGPITLVTSHDIAATYDVRIAEIRQLLDRKQGGLDSATMRVLAINLRVIDEAIARVRTALDSMPANTMLSQKLTRAYELKLNTLRQFAAMSTE